jgi:predicted GH43/DUF377 family glycosyl hydrolase
VSAPGVGPDATPAVAPDRDGPLVERSDVVLGKDPRRVVARVFVPGHDAVLALEARSSSVMARILALTDAEVTSALVRVRTRFALRHRDLHGLLERHFGMIAHRVPDSSALTEAQRELVGAWFTQEFALEGAALFNPSAVAHPDQSGLAEGEVRFVMSVRAVGEGHLSTVEFRTGVAGPGRALRVDDPGPHAETGTTRSTVQDRGVFTAALAREGVDGAAAAPLLARLPRQFDAHDLDRALQALAARTTTPGGSAVLEQVARRVAAYSYEVEFSEATTIAERVLWPHSPAESRGMEDARFVRWTGDDGAVLYRATYTAYDGDRITPQVIETRDFRRFRVVQHTGPAVADKGMALFPRTIGGRHLALTRTDRENTGISTSEDGLHWPEPVVVHGPTQPWELVQTGNCGSPIETEAGWLVLTHGVGPVREYCIGAVLLDLEDPTRVIGELRGPLLAPDDDEREGYVPNVVYSCGALPVGDQLLLPYGASDDSVRFAFVDLPGLVAQLLADGPAATAANSSA